MNKYYSIVPTIALSASAAVHPPVAAQIEAKQNIAYVQEMWAAKGNDFKARAQRKWSQLTDDDLLQIKADSCLLKVIVKKRYANLKPSSEIDNQLREFLTEIKEECEQLKQT